MNRRIASLATLFAAGAFVASAAPVTTTVRTSADTLMTQKGCGADKDKKQASCSADKGKKDASCGKGSCGSAK
ncbi:MAG TPA: hypothetical protein VFT46_03505 [Holophagaceae bacterium]|nr:hypothetical protein [Holophagaceae bacterium]